MKPLLLDRHLRSAQARINSVRTPASQEDPRTAVLLMIRGAFGARPEEVLTSVMNLVATRLQLRLHHGSPSRTLPLHHWLEIRNGNNDWIGNVRIQLESLDEVRALRGSIHGKVISLNGENHSVEIHNAFFLDDAVSASTPGRQRNGSGVGSRGQRSPQDSRASR